MQALWSERHRERNDFSQIMFRFQTGSLTARAVQNLTFLPLDLEEGSTRTELALLFQEHESQLQGTIEYDSNLFDQATIERMSIHYRCLLGGIVIRPEQRITNLPH